MKDIVITIDLESVDYNKHNEKLIGTYITNTWSSGLMGKIGQVYCFE